MHVLFFRIYSLNKAFFWKPKISNVFFVLSFSWSLQAKALSWNPQGERKRGHLRNTEVLFTLQALMLKSVFFISNPYCKNDYPNSMFQVTKCVCSDESHLVTLLVVIVTMVVCAVMETDWWCSCFLWSYVASYGDNTYQECFPVTLNVQNHSIQTLKSW
jgi:hypothetical protein